MKKENKKNTREQKDFDFEIDYDLFTTAEIIKIFEFYSLIIKNSKQKVNKDILLNSYKEYKKIINNLSLEKKYDNLFFKKTNISIYHTIKSLS